LKKKIENYKLNVIPANYPNLLKISTKKTGQYLEKSWKNKCNSLKFIDVLNSIRKFFRGGICVGFINPVRVHEV